MTDNTKYRIFVVNRDGESATVEGYDGAILSITACLAVQGYRYDEEVDCWHNGFYDRVEHFPG